MLRTLKYKSLFFSEFSSELGQKLLNKSKLDDIDVYRVKTSSVSPFIALRQSTSIIVEDFRYYEYAIALAISLKGWSFDDELFGNSHEYGKKVIEALFYELKANEDKNYLMDITLKFYDYDNNNVCVYDILPELTNIGYYKDYIFNIFIQSIPAILINHESKHFELFKNNYERNTQIVLMIDEVIELAYEIKRISKQQDDLISFIYDSEIIINYAERGDKKSRDYKMISEEVYCDFAMLKETFGLIVDEYFEDQTNRKNVYSSIVALIEAHWLFHNSLILIEYTRLKSFDRNQSTYEQFSEGFYIREAFMKFGLVFIIKEKFSDDKKIMNELLIKVLAMSFWYRSRAHKIIIESLNDNILNNLKMKHSELVNSVKKSPKLKSEMINRALLYLYGK